MMGTVNNINGHNPPPLSLSVFAETVGTTKELDKDSELSITFTLSKGKAHKVMQSGSHRFRIYWPGGRILFPANMFCNWVFTISPYFNTSFGT